MSVPDESKAHDLSRLRDAIRSGDPREAGGDIAGPGGPEEKNSVVLDTSYAVLLDNMTMAVGHNSDGRDFVGMMLEGRINQKSTRTRILYITDGDGLAALLTEAESLVHRAEQASGRFRSPWLREFYDAYEARVETLRAQGLLPPAEPDPT